MHKARFRTGSQARRLPACLAAHAVLAKGPTGGPRCAVGGPTRLRSSLHCCLLLPEATPLGLDELQSPNSKRPGNHLRTSLDKDLAALCNRLVQLPAEVSRDQRAQHHRLPARKVQVHLSISADSTPSDSFIFCRFAAPLEAAAAAEARQAEHLQKPGMCGCSPGRASPALLRASQICQPRAPDLSQLARDFSGAWGTAGKPRSLRAPRRPH